MMTFPELTTAQPISEANRRWYVGAYGFEDRSLGWTQHYQKDGKILNGALMFNYKNPKGDNRIVALKDALSALGVDAPSDLDYDALYPQASEEKVAKRLRQLASQADEIVLDVSAMTKLLCLTSLCYLSSFHGKLRIVYSEAEDYAPAEDSYAQWRREMGALAGCPSQGVQSLVRAKCLSSIRMQGQPVTMIAFTSFNEQLVRHMLGTIIPHRLILINGRPLRRDYEWRELATREIHNQVIDEYRLDNPDNQYGYLFHTVSTLDYRQTIQELHSIYQRYGTHERLICGATGSKMQTVGLFFAKVLHPDFHVEYPTPDSYYATGLSKGVRAIHEISIDQFAACLGDIARHRRSWPEPSLTATASSGTP